MTDAALGLRKTYTPPTFVRSDLNLTVTSARAIYGFICIYLASAMGFNAVVLKPVGSLAPSTIFIASWLLMHGIAGLLFLLYMRMNIRTLIFGLCFVSYIFATTIAGPNYSVTLPYVIMLTGNLLFAALCVRTLSLDSFMILLRRVIVALVLASLLAFLAGLDKVNYIDAHQRLNILGLEPIRGFFAHKIMASLFCGIGMLLVIEAPKYPYKSAILGLMVIFIMLTGSSTGLVLAISLFVIRYLVKLCLRVRLSSALFISLFLFLSLCTLSFLTIYGTDILIFLERDPTLTGRTLLWEWGIDTALQKPVFGWGFGNYFTTNSAFATAQSYFVFQNYDVPHFHQSYIQTAVDFGFLGLALLMWMLLKSILFHYKNALLYNNTASRQVVQILLLCIFASTTMFIFLNYNHVVTVFLMVVLLYALDRKTPDDAQ